MNQSPESFHQFLTSLQEDNLNDLSNFDEDLGQILRMQASTKDYGAIMTSGKSALPYVPWLIDGMSMSNKLIVHLNDDEKGLNQIVKTSMESDIRITSHCQDQRVFTTDISEHRMDLLLLTEDALSEIEKLDEVTL